MSDDSAPAPAGAGSEDVARPGHAERQPGDGGSSLPTEFWNALHEWRLALEDSQILKGPAVNERLKRSIDRIHRAVAGLAPSRDARGGEMSETPKCQRCGRTIPKQRRESAASPDYCTERCAKEQDRDDEDSAKDEWGRAGEETSDG